MCALEVAAPDVSIAGAIAEWFGPRAADVDAGRLAVRDGLAELQRHGLAEASIGHSIGLVRAVAREDVATAFSAWAHRMTIDYLTAGGPQAQALVSSLSSAQTLGSTALAAGTAHVLAGVPLPVSFRTDREGLVLDGRIPWASNLIEPFVMVTAAVDADDPERAIVVAIPSGTAGLQPAPHPDLLALNATGSTTIKLVGVRVPKGLRISSDLHGFVGTILARFLLLQGAFCSGLADRALAEAAADPGPMGDALGADLERISSAATAADGEMARLASDSEAGRRIVRVDLLRLRLRWSELATAAVHLELAATGGRGYLSSSPTARRVREAAFLPVQAPTEVLLRWLLSRSA